MAHVRRPLFPVTAVLLTAALFSPSLAASGAPRGQGPNIVFILADDLGWADLGCYGNTFHQTPNLDKLAAQGMRFTDAYAASSVCSPTRSSILSGKYPARNDLTIWLNGRSPVYAKLLDAPHATELALEEITIAEALKPAGYATASVGKWHLGGEPFYPQHQGFDLNVAGTSNGSPAGGYFLPNKMDLPDATKGKYLTDWLTDEAVKFIDAHHQEPFFLYLPYHAVHTPIQGKKKLIELYQKRMEPGQKNTNPAYAAMVHTLDENVGRIMKQLDDLDLADRTALFFFSDNGGYHRVTSNAPLRLGKGYSYEGGHREPLIVRLPGRVEPGSVSSTPVVSVDFYPTILELAGVEGDPRHNAHVDGVSIVPLMEQTGTLQREAIYWHYPHYSPQGGTPSGAVRVGDLKLIEFFEDGRLELYNLAEDVGETVNLVDDVPQTARRLHEMLVGWRERVDAKMPKPNPNAGPKPVRRELPAVEPTKSFPGFDVLTDVNLVRSTGGYLVASNKTGLALTKTHAPLGPTATFHLRLTPRVDFPANGFLAFGDASDEEKLVKCGLFIGGSYAAIYEGAYPSDDMVRLTMPFVPRATYDLAVRVDLAQSTVEMAVGSKRLQKKLSRKIDAIRYYGYQAITTQSEFIPIECDED